MPKRGTGYQTRMGRPRLGKRRKPKKDVQPRVAAALALKAAGIPLSEIKDKLGYNNEKAVSSAITRAKQQLARANIGDPIAEARDTVAQKLVPKALRAYEDTLDNKKHPALRLIAATHTLKGSQVFTPKTENQQTRKGILENIETKRLEIAFEHNLVDKFDLTPIEAEVISEQLTGEVK